MMASLAAGKGKAAWEDDYDLTPEQGERLIRAASSDYFMLSDQDDVWLPCKAQMLLRKMQELEGSASKGGLPVLVHSDLKVVDEHLGEIAPSFSAIRKYRRSAPAFPSCWYRTMLPAAR